MANNTNNNKIVVPEARAALNQMKLEIANELGLQNYDNIDKGNLTSRQNGYVGGYMVKKISRVCSKPNGWKIKISLRSGIPLLFLLWYN